MFNLSQIKSGKNIILDGVPFAVLYHEQSKVGRAGSVLRTRLKNLKNGSVLEKTFQGADQVEEAEINKSKAQYIYQEGNEYYFMDQKSYDQFSLSKEALGENINYLKEETEVTIFNFDGKPINISLPVKMELEVTQAPPSIKGNTASGGEKIVTVETGAKISVPLFIKTGDKIIVNTEKGDYVSRA
jgi:elongation factor P